MITVYKEINKTLEKKVVEDLNTLEVETGSWIHISEPTQEILEKISEITEIPSDLLFCALDEEESARIDVDDGNTLIVLDTPYLSDQEKGLYSSAPFIIAYNYEYYVTIERHSFELMDELFKRVKIIEPHKHVRLTLNFVYRLATLFITYLKRINLHTDELEKKIRNSTKNKEVLELMDINKSLIYFSTALNGDKGVLAKLLKSQTYNRYESDYDLMEDAQVEINQAVEMCTILRDVLTGMMDAFASIINNNMNIIMKSLTVITIVLSIPTLVASFFGMNVVDLPLANTEHGFYIIFAISFVLAIIVAIVLILVSNRNKTRK